MFGSGTNLDNVPTYNLSKDKVNTITLVDLVSDSKLCASKSEARRMIEGGGVYLNEEKVTDFRRVITDGDFAEGYALLRKGKKNFIKVVIE